MRKFLFFIFLSLFLVLFVACTPKTPIAQDNEQVSDEEKIVIRFSHVVGEDTPKGQAARLFAKLMKERTNGRVEVQVFPNGSLYKDIEEVTALQQGKVQIIAPALSKVSYLIPELGAFDLPFLFPSLNDYHQVLDGEVGNLLKRSIENKDMVPLSFWDSGFKQFTNNENSIREPEDLSGLTMRIMPSTVLDKQFTLLQVNPVEINFNDVYLALEQNKINGQENTISNIYTKRFYRVQKFMTLSNHGYLGYIVLMNENFWRELPADIQDAISSTMKEVTDWQRRQTLAIEQAQLQDIYACDCITIETLSEAEKEEWRTFFQPLYKSMENRLGKEFFNRLYLREDGVSYP